MSHPDATVREKAKTLFREVGGYGTRWPNATAIQADAAGFVRDTMNVMGHLGARVMGEDDELYPLADALG